MARILRFALGVFCLGLWAWGSTLSVSAQEATSSVTDANVVLPTRFIARTLVSGFTLPTDMVILPSGDLLVAEKGVGAGSASKANVRFVRGGVLQPEPVLTLSVNSEEDSGLLGITIDPNFAANGFFYVWYGTGEDALGWDGESYNRLSRFVFDAVTGKASLADEVIILDKVPWAPLHNGGGLVFDHLGNLLITTGDAGGNIVVPEQSPAQSLFSLSGKVLRIRPLLEGGYTIPVDNPYAGTVGGVRQEIYAMGLRNPFRIVQRAADQQIYFIDVGQDTWEEVNLLTAGANYGWPAREGRCELNQMVDCSPTPEVYTDPLVVYLHPLDSGAGFTALEFYEGAQWPAPYQGQLYVADLNSNWVGKVDVNGPDPAITDFATEINAVVDLEATDEGLYALSIVDGAVEFIYHDDTGNHPPTAQWQVGPTQGTAPHRVTFQATAQDLDNDNFSYVWDFGDGLSITTELSSTAHVYELDGDYLVTLQVIDEDGGRSEILSALIQVYSGAQPVIVQENLRGSGRVFYHGGDELRFSVQRTGGQEGLHPVQPYAWTILLNHNEHSHYLLAEYINDDVLLQVPTKTHALNSPLWYQVQLTMNTAGGQKIKRTLDVVPQTTTIQVQSWPGTANITIDHQVQPPEAQTLVIVGQEYTLEAPQNVIHNGMVGEFTNWVVTPSWPLASAETETVIVTDRVYTLVATAEANTYVAFYEYVRSAQSVYLPGVYGNTLAR